MTKTKPLVLIIRDGWGVSPSPRSAGAQEGNAVALASTPVHDKLWATYPCSLLGAVGEDVGLPAGQMGNSEVGHLNLGSGRIVYQDFTRISKAISDGSFFANPALLASVRGVREANKTLHLMGLCSDGGVHSHLVHLFALVEMAKREGVKNVCVHCIMDGRDTSPTSGLDFISQVQAKLAQLGVGRIASITGRFFAMDRDNRWDRVAEAYRAIVQHEGHEFTDPVAAMRHWYEQSKTDEFIPPTIINQPGQSSSCAMTDGDGVIFFNFRSDRARELTRAITEPEFSGFKRTLFAQTNFVTMTQYDQTFTLPIAFEPLSMKNILTEVLAANKLRQLRIAETEKYAHVTFFFSGGIEEPVAGEDRCMIPSPKVKTYDLQPEMSAAAVTDQVVARITAGTYDVIILNFANADMVGHTGFVQAAIRAVETVDKCVGKVLEAIKDAGGTALITADHGNAERMLELDGSPFTAHTINPVQLIYVADDHADWKLKPGILADVAPTMLTILGLPVPPEMTGKSLLVPKNA